MSFHWPLAFWALLIPAAFGIAEWRRRRSVGNTAHPKILRAEAGGQRLSLSRLEDAPVTTSRIRWRLWMGSVFLIVAFARPQWGRLEEPVFEQAREIVIAMDLSRSMLAQDVKPSRLERSKLLITGLLEKLAGERVGLIVFSGTAFLQSPLSADYEILREFLPSLNPDFLPEGGTNYRSLLQTAVDAFGSSSGADRYLIILSDGEAQTDDWKPLIADLKTKGVRVIGLGIGTSAGAMLPDGSGAFIKDERGAVVLSKLESGTLRELADATQGVYTDASSWVDLPQLLQSTVESGRKGDFHEQSRVRLAERFQWALAPALFFFALSFWREFPVHPKPRSLRLSPASAGAQPSAAEPKSTRPLTPTGSAVSLIAIAVLKIGVVLAVSLANFPAALAADEAAAQPLSQLIGQFSARDRLSAHDYAELARTTVTYAERVVSGKLNVPEGPIHDALAAVDAGSAADAKAADWPQLRSDLEKFLQKPEPPPPQNQPQNPPPEQSKDKKNDSSQNKSSSGDQSKNNDAQKKPEDSPDQKPGGGQKNDPSQGSPSSGQDKQNDQKKENSSPQSAFGDMKDQKPEPPKTTPAEASETQKVGGVSEKKGDAAPVDPALSVPLQKLEQVRNQDSPAKLYQLMQGESSPPKKTGKNW
jgi:Ca-activated chloride channel family protein